MASRFAKVSHIAVMLSVSLRTVHRRIEENGLFAEKESWTKHTAKQWANALSSEQWDMLGETKCVLLCLNLKISLRTVHRRIEENGLFAEKESWTKHTAKQWANALSSEQWDMLGETKCVLLCLNLKIDLTGLVFRVKSWKTDSQKWFNSQRNTRW